MRVCCWLHDVSWMSLQYKDMWDEAGSRRTVLGVQMLAVVVSRYGKEIAKQNEGRAACKLYE